MRLDPNSVLEPKQSVHPLASHHSHSLCLFQGSPAAWLAPPMALWGSSGLKSETGWVHQRHPCKHPHL